MRCSHSDEASLMFVLRWICRNHFWVLHLGVGPNLMMPTCFPIRVINEIFYWLERFIFGEHWSIWWLVLWKPSLYDLASQHTCTKDCIGTKKNVNRQYSSLTTTFQHRNHRALPWKSLSVLSALEGSLIYKWCLPDRTASYFTSRYL